jgi:hypothetical protein
MLNHFLPGDAGSFVATLWLCLTNETWCKCVRFTEAGHSGRRSEAKASPQSILLTRVMDSGLSACGRAPE